MIRYDQERNLVLIVMELLEVDPNAKAVIQDIFGQGEVGFQRTDLALQDMDVLKLVPDDIVKESDELRKKLEEQL